MIHHHKMKILQVMVNGDDKGANIHALYRNISMRFDRKLHNQYFEHACCDSSKKTRMNMTRMMRVITFVSDTCKVPDHNKDLTCSQ
jgi:hypothetical protein